MHIFFLPYIYHPAPSYFILPLIKKLLLFDNALIACYNWRMNNKPFDFETLSFKNDLVFSEVLMDKEICKELVETIFDKKIANINNPQRIEKTFLTSRGVRFDIRFERNQKLIDVEVQIFEDLDEYNRSQRYLDSCSPRPAIPGEILDPIECLSSDAELSFFIFFCLADPYEENIPVYTLEYRMKGAPDIKDLGPVTKTLNVNAFEKLEAGPLRSLLEYVATGRVSSVLSRMIDRKVEEVTRPENLKVLKKRSKL